MVPPQRYVIEAKIAEALAAGRIDASIAQLMRYRLRVECRATNAARRRRPPSATPN